MCCGSCWCGGSWILSRHHLLPGLWFPAEERAAAVSKFMTATAIAGVVGAPMSAALFTLDGVAGLAGWQWIFVAEGIPSVVLGVVVLFFLTERPDVAGWLSPEQRRYLSALVKVGDDAIARRGIGLRAALLHPIVWWLALLYFTLILGFYSISFWSPQIIQSLSGLGNVQVALVSAIPYIVAAIAMVIVGAHSDRTRERCAHVAAAAVVGALGMAASAYVQSPYLGVLALSVAAAGIWSAVPVFWSLPTVFLTGTAAAGAIALINSFGNLAGFVGPYVIGRVHDATNSYSASLLVVAASLLCSVGIALSLRGVLSPSAEWRPDSRPRP